MNNGSAVTWYITLPHWQDPLAGSFISDPPAFILGTYLEAHGYFRQPFRSRASATRLIKRLLAAGTGESLQHLRNLNNEFRQALVAAERRED